MSEPALDAGGASVGISARLLVIDDRPDDQQTAFALADGVVTEVVHPEEVVEDMLNAADLVLVDYDISDWPARSRATEIGLRPANGIALAAVLREHTVDLPRPTGFAIHTGEARRFSVSPPEPRAHLLARTHNLEWVFVKGQPDIVAPQAASLAKAIRRLPESWPADNREAVERMVRQLLGLPDQDHEEAPSWTQAAMRDVAQCRPPLSEVVERNHGLLFVRWILHRILPYPCFLFDTHHLAVRLQVTHASLVSALEGGLAGLLGPARYDGVLAGFLGPRWWRAGIESILWGLGGSMAARRLHAKLDEATGIRLTPFPGSEPVSCIDQNYVPLAEPCPADEVVRIVPDDWPSYAGQAWATAALAREHPRLAAIVAESDQDRLHAPKPGK